MSKSGITCYRNGGCGPYEMMSCNECPASKSDYLQHDVKKPMTNADRIRAMSDEELADWIIGVIQHGGVIPYGGTGVTLDWLKQEADNAKLD